MLTVKAKTLKSLRSTWWKGTLLVVLLSKVVIEFFKRFYHSKVRSLT